MSRTKEHRSILVIEPEDGIRTDLCEWLQETGFEAVGENNGHSGLSQIVLREKTSEPIDGVLMSMNLILFSTTSVLKELRQKHPTLPVVLIGDHWQAATMAEMMTLGALGYMHPPFEPDAFKNECRAFFRHPDQSDS